MSDYRKAKGKKRRPYYYGIIVIFANICGVLISGLVYTNGYSDLYLGEWERFLNDFEKWVNPFQYLTFIVPAVFCSLYSASKKESHFIDMPFAFAALGMTGWLVYGIEEIFFIIVALNKGYAVNVSYVLSSSFLSILLNSLTAFSISFFILETIHRKYILPKYYPEGKLSKVQGIRHPSVSLLFISNYLSVTLFPIVFLLMAIFSMYASTGVQVNKNTFLVLVIILAIGIFITAAFVSFFQNPLSILKKRIGDIEKGDYKTKTRIITTDSFGELSDILNDLTDSLDAKIKRIDEIQNSVVTGMAVMVESRDNSTGGHVKRTSDCVRVFLDFLSKNPKFDYIDEKFRTYIIKAAPMHDLGKIAVDDAVLRKPGKFTDEEYAKMKVHPEEGAKIVEKVLVAVDDDEFKKVAMNVAHYHHEKWNGQGYPTGISGEQIPLEARIMALADVFDALVSKRCYKDSFTYDKAFEIIRDSLGTHFDPVLGEEFIKCRSELENLYNSY